MKFRKYTSPASINILLTSFDINITILTQVDMHIWHLQLVLIILVALTVITDNASSTYSQYWYASSTYKY